MATELVAKCDYVFFKSCKMLLTKTKLSIALEGCHLAVNCRRRWGLPEMNRPHAVLVKQLRQPLICELEAA